MNLMAILAVQRQAPAGLLTCGNDLSVLQRETVWPLPS